MSEVLLRSKYCKMIEELDKGDEKIHVRKEILCCCLSDEQSNQAMHDIMVQLLVAQGTYDDILNHLEQSHKAEGFLSESRWRNYTTLKNLADEEYKKNTKGLMNKLKKLTKNFTEDSVQWGDVGVVKEGVNPVLMHTNNISDSLKCKLNSLEKVAEVLVALEKNYVANKSKARQTIREVDAAEVTFTKLKDECRNENEAEKVMDAMEKMKKLCFEKKNEFLHISKELLAILDLSSNDIAEVEEIMCKVFRYQPFLFCGNDLEAYHNRYHAEVFHFMNMHLYRVVFGIIGRGKSANNMEEDGDPNHRFMLSNCVLHRRFTEGYNVSESPEVTNEEKTAYMLYLAVVCRMYSMDNKRRSQLLSHTIDKVNKSLLIVVDTKDETHPHSVSNLLAPHSVENMLTDMEAFTLKIPCMSNGELYTREVSTDLKFHPSSLNLAPIVVEHLSYACRVWIVGQLRMTKVNGDRWYYVFADVVTCMVKDFTLLLEHKLKKYNEVKGYESYEIVKIQAMICYLIKVLWQFSNKELQWSDFEDNTSEFGLLWHISSCEESSIPFTQLQIKLDKRGVKRGIEKRARECGKIWEKKEYLNCCATIISVLNEAGIMGCDTPLLNIKLIHSYLVKLKIIEERDMEGEVDAAEQAMKDLEREEAEQASKTETKKKRKKNKKKKKKKNKMAKAAVQSIIEDLITSVIDIEKQKELERHNIYVEAARIGQKKTAEKAKAIAIAEEVKRELKAQKIMERHNIYVEAARIGKKKTAEKAKAIAEEKWKREVKAQNIKSFRYFRRRRYPLQICLEEWKRQVKEAKAKETVKVLPPRSPGEIIKVLPPRFSPTHIQAINAMENIHPKKRMSHLQVLWENQELKRDIEYAFDEVSKLEQEKEDFQRYQRVDESIIHAMKVENMAMKEQMKAMEAKMKEQTMELDELREENIVLEHHFMEVWGDCMHLSSVSNDLENTLHVERNYNNNKLNMLFDVLSNVSKMCNWATGEKQ